MTYEEMQGMMEFILEQQAQLKANMRKLEERQQRLEAAWSPEWQLLLRKPLIRPKKSQHPADVILLRAEETIRKLENSVSGQ